MMIRRALALTVSILSISAAPIGAAEIEGVEFAQSYDWNGTSLRLNGTGLLRHRIFIKGYVAALYLAEGVDPDEALSDVPRRLEIEYFWAIPAEAFARAAEQHISGELDSQALARIRGPLERLNSLYEDVKPGDRYALTYVPGIGTELSLNGEALGVVEGAELSAAVFAIWLGPRPINETLRSQLLAGL